MRQRKAARGNLHICRQGRHWYGKAATRRKRGTKGASEHPYLVPGLANDDAWDGLRACSAISSNSSGYTALSQRAELLAVVSSGLALFDRGNEIGKVLGVLCEGRLRCNPYLRKRLLEHHRPRNLRQLRVAHQVQVGSVTPWRLATRAGWSSSSDTVLVRLATSRPELN